MVPKASIILAVAASTVLAVPATTNKRIVGGELAKAGEIPYIVRLHYGEEKDTMCGGSLLDSTTVLTAGHCRLRNVTSVRAGSLDRETGGVVAGIQSRLAHPDCARPFRANRNDIAILKLSTPIRETDVIRYAKLPASGSDLVIGSIAVAAGWGERGDLPGTGGVSDKLLKVAMPIDTPTQCFEGDCDSSREIQSHLDTKICAGADGKDTGRGDSGGPLIDQATGELIGITSFVATGTALGHGFYTKVSRYIPWINENLGAAGIDPRGTTD